MFGVLIFIHPTGPGLSPSGLFYRGFYLALVSERLDITLDPLEMPIATLCGDSDGLLLELKTPVLQNW